MTEVGQLSFRPIILLKFRLLQVNLLLPAVIGKVRKRGFFLRPSLRGALRRLNPTIPRHNAAPSNRFPQPVIVRSAATSQSSHPSYFDKPLVRTRSLQRFVREVSPTVIARSAATSQSTCCSIYCKFIFCFRSKTVLRTRPEMIVTI